MLWVKVLSVAFMLQLLLFAFRYLLAERRQAIMAGWAPAPGGRGPESGPPGGGLTVPDGLALPGRPWRLETSSLGPGVIVHPMSLPGRRLLGEFRPGPARGSRPEDQAGENSPFRPIRFGRASDNDVIITDATASAHHARFLIRAGSLWVEDLYSTNGTLVNGTRISQVVRLLPGDRVAIGTNTFTVTR